MKKIYNIFGANNTAKIFLNNNKNIKFNNFYDNNSKIEKFKDKKVNSFKIFNNKNNNYKFIICSTQFYNIFLQLKKKIKKSRIKFFFDFKNKEKIILKIINHQRDFIAINKLLNKKSVIIDVGGNTGLLSLFLFLKKKIKYSYIFEPQKNLCKSMKLIFNKFKFYNFKIFNKVLSDSNYKTFSLYLPYKDHFIYSGHASLDKKKIALSRKEKKILKFKKIKVNNYNTKFLFSMLKRKKENINFIKIDVEGSEIPVLNNLKKIILFNKPIIYVEILRKNNKKFLNYVKQNLSFYNLYQLQDDKLVLNKKNISVHKFLIKK